MVRLRSLLASVAFSATLFACAQPRPAAPPAPTPDTTTAAAAAAATPLIGPVDTRVPSNWRFPIHPAPAVAAHGMLATDSPLGTRVGIQMLQQGGNAVDAAVAAALAMAVVYPEAGNLGGGGFAVVHMADGTTASLDFREMAPAAASRNMYLDASGNMTDKSLFGYLASGVPGSAMGLWMLHERFGKLPWKTVIAPAIHYAEDGFPVDSALHASLAAAAPRLSKFPASAALFLPGGQAPAVGTTFRNPELGKVLERLAEQGPPGFYEGETAKLIAADMKRGGGIITEQDLKNYQAKWRDPVVFTYRGHQVISMPPASSGGLTLALICNILEGYDLGKLGWHSPEALHLVAESMKRAFADRNAFLGDPDFVQVPRDRFLSTDYAAQLRATILPNKATPAADIRPGAPAVHEGNNTTHLSVVDGMGDAVALTYTLNELYGSAVTIPGTGIVMNDEMDDFAGKPGTPNMFGLVQGEADAIQPGKRPLSAMTPTIVLDSAGRPMLVTGARGGSRIITAAFQVISNVLDFGMDIGTAVAVPRIHDQHLPDQLSYERNGLTPEIITDLEAMGYKVVPSGGIGDAPSILRRGDSWTGYADPRSGGLAEGY